MAEPSSGQSGPTAQPDGLGSRWLPRVRRTRLYGFGVRHRFIVQAGIDSLAWALAIVAATVMRYEFDPSRVSWPRLVALLPVAALLQVAAGHREGLYAGQWRFGSFDEVAGVVRTVVVATVGLALLNRFAFGHLIPVSASIASGLFSLVVMCAARYVWRLVLERRRRPSEDTARRVLVFGAGEGGAQVITAMLRNPESPYIPVALLDDDPAKRFLRITGVPVAGTRMAMAVAAQERHAEAIVIAIPSAGATLIRELAEMAQLAGLDVLVLPPVADLFGGRVGVSDIRPVTEEDLLGRRQIDTDVASIAGYLTGKRVLVTGAGGSIGSELCRQIYQFAPAELMMLDRDESALHAVQLSLDGRGLLDSPNLILANIREGERVREIFEERRPDVVFHAAALKHLPLLERYPQEGVAVNVFGTLNLLEAAMASGAERFVNISTDKAADPCSVLGYTKRIAERLTAWAASETGLPYLSVRFGNVLGSRGSVLTAFRAQIDAGGPVTVTHPDVTRYFMTVQEAVQLVIQAGAIGRPGEALVLDMGDPVKIADVAGRLVAQADRPIDIVYTGLRPGEKLEEVLLGSAERDVRPNHPLISQVCVRPLNAAHLAAGDAPPVEQMLETMSAMADPSLLDEPRP